VLLEGYPQVHLFLKSGDATTRVIAFPAALAARAVIGFHNKPASRHNGSLLPMSAANGKPAGINPSLTIRIDCLTICET
jgi:hypothetical protein